MSGHIIFPSRWSTSSFGEAADTSPLELAALGQHLDHCRAAPSGLSMLRYCAEKLHSFVAARFMTTVLVVTLLMGGCLLAL
jgi:hypothetical protein